MNAVDSGSHSNSGAQGVRIATGELATLLHAELLGSDSIILDGIESMHAAGPAQLTFISTQSFAGQWADCNAGAALVSRGIEVPGHDPVRRALLVVDDAEQSMIDMLERLAPEAACPPPGVHPSASIDSTAQLGADVCIGPFVSVGPEATIGSGAILEEGVRVGRSAAIGAGAWLGMNAVIGERCVVGERCRLHAMVCLGADGFGYRPRSDGSGLRKVPHIGTVHIGADVELGAGTCVDRGKFGATVIGDGTKLDNLVQIGHNVRIGEHCVIAAQTGLAGSVVVGNWVQIGAQAGVTQHVTIGDGARIGAKAGVIRDVAAGSSVAGIPADDSRITLRQISCIRKLPEFMATVRSQGKSGDDA